MAQASRSFYHLIERRKAMVTLEERLCSRFEWGLIADIQPPGLETRIAILRTKAAAYDLDIPDTILVLIASRIESNIRELEGALNRMVALATLTHQPLNIEMAEATLAELSPQHPRWIPMRSLKRWLITSTSR